MTWIKPGGYKLRLLNQHKRRCNTFFMELVSQLCFVLFSVKLYKLINQYNIWCSTFFMEWISRCVLFCFREAIEAHNQYKRRCNTFFMELVSQLCFAEGKPPEPAVITMLMSCVTRQSKLEAAASRRTTKKLTIFDDCIDPTPVVRSVLLQLLLRSK